MYTMAGIIPNRSGQRERCCAAWRRSCRPARKLENLEMAKKVTRCVPELHFPCSDSAPGGGRVTVSRVSHATRLRPTTTSPKPTSPLWSQARAAAAAVHLQKLARHRLRRGLHRNRGGGDRTGRAGVRRRLLSPAQTNSGVFGWH